MNAGSNSIEWSIRLRALQEISQCTTEELVALAASSTFARDERGASARASALLRVVR